MEFNIAVAKGDGIGPEVVDSGIEILNTIGKLFNHNFNYKEVAVGGYAYDIFEDPLPQETIDVCNNSDAVLFGAVGGKKWDDVALDKRPEKAILGLRKKMGLYANIRPGILFKSLKEVSPLKDSIINKGFDIMVVRELTGGIYFGEKGIKDGKMGKEAYDVESYSEIEIERIAKIAFDMAMKRNKKITSVDKANVLESSRLWRSVVEKVSRSYPEIDLNHMYVDNAAMQVIRQPDQFDIILTSNIFGDILSDEISMITGSIGLLPSASLGENKGLYEPIHGSAPDIAGKNIANPIATILSISLMLKYSLGLEREGQIVNRAVNRTLEDGYRTIDIAANQEEGLGTREITMVIKKNIEKMVSD